NIVRICRSVRKRIKTAEQSQRVGIDLVGWNRIIRKRRAGRRILDSRGENAGALCGRESSSGESALRRRRVIDNLRTLPQIPALRNEEEGFILFGIVVIRDIDRAAHGEPEHILMKGRSLRVEEIARIQNS